MQEKQSLTTVAYLLEHFQHTQHSAYFIWCCEYDKNTTKKNSHNATNSSVHIEIQQCDRANCDNVRLHNGLAATFKLIASSPGYGKKGFSTVFVWLCHRFSSFFTSLTELFVEYTTQNVPQFEFFLLNEC